MKTTVQFVEMLMARYDLKSIYALAKLLNQTHTSVSRWAKGTGSFSDETAMHVADLLDLDPAYVVACIHAERAKAEEEKKMWARIAERMAIAAVIVLAVILTPYLPSDHAPMAIMAGFTSSASPALYIMSNAIWHNWPVFLALFALWLWAFPRDNHRPKK